MLLSVLRFMTVVSCNSKETRDISKSERRECVIESCHLMYRYIHVIKRNLFVVCLCACVGLSMCVCVHMHVGSCLATKVFIGKLLAT